MAIAVIYGLSFATVLTLVIVPALYVMIFRLVARWGFGGLAKADAAAAEPQHGADATETMKPL